MEQISLYLPYISLPISPTSPLQVQMEQISLYLPYLPPYISPISPLQVQMEQISLRAEAEQDARAKQQLRKLEAEAETLVAREAALNLRWEAERGKLTRLTRTLTLTLTLALALALTLTLTLALALARQADAAERAQGGDRARLPRGRAGGAPYISLHLPTSPYISPHLHHISPHISQAEAEYELERAAELKYGRLPSLKVSQP